MYGTPGLLHNGVQVQRRLLAMQRLVQQQQQLLLQQQQYAIQKQQPPLQQEVALPVIAPIVPLFSRPLSLADLKPSVVVVLQRLIHENLTQYREAIQSKDPLRVQTAIATIYGALSSTLAPFGNLIQELPPRDRVEGLIRSSLDRLLVGQSTTSLERHDNQSSKGERQLDQQKALCVQIISILKQQQAEATALLNLQTLDPVTHSRVANGLVERQRLMDAQSVHLDTLMQLEQQLSATMSRTPQQSSDTIPVSISHDITATPNDSKALSKGDFTRKLPGTASSGCKSKGTNGKETRKRVHAKQKTSEIESPVKHNVRRKRKRPMILPIPRLRKSMIEKDNNIVQERISTNEEKPSTSIFKMKQKKKKQNKKIKSSFVKPDLPKSSSVADIANKTDKNPSSKISRENGKAIKRKRTTEQVGKLPMRKRRVSEKCKTSKNVSPTELVDEVSRSDGPIPDYLPPSSKRALKLLAPHNAPGNTTAGDNAFIIDTALNSLPPRYRKRRRQNIDYSGQC